MKEPIIEFDENTLVLTVNGKEINEGFYIRDKLDSQIVEVAELIGVEVNDVSRYTLKAKIFKEHLELIAKHLLEGQSI